MIIKTAIRTLRHHEIPEVERERPCATSTARCAAQPLVEDVLELRAPIQYDYASVDLNQICQAAGDRAMAASREGRCLSWIPSCERDDGRRPPARRASSTS